MLRRAYSPVDTRALSQTSAVWSLCSLASDILATLQHIPLATSSKLSQVTDCMRGQMSENCDVSHFQEKGVLHHFVFSCNWYSDSVCSQGNIKTFVFGWFPLRCTIYCLAMKRSKFNTVLRYNLEVLVLSFHGASSAERFSVFQLIVFGFTASNFTALILSHLSPQLQSPLMITNVGNVSQKCWQLWSASVCLFWADFSKSDWLLIVEWKQLGGIFHPANRGVTTPFLWRP